MREPLSNAASHEHRPFKLRLQPNAAGRGLRCAEETCKKALTLQQVMHTLREPSVAFTPGGLKPGVWCTLPDG